MITREQMARLQPGGDKLFDEIAAAIDQTTEHTSEQEKDRLFKGAVDAAREMFAA